MFVKIIQHLFKLQFIMTLKRRIELRVTLRHSSIYMNILQYKSKLQFYYDIIWKKKTQYCTNLNIESSSIRKQYSNIENLKISLTL